MKPAVVPRRLQRSDRDRTMITPEGIALPLTIASRGTRASALILDLTFIVMLMVITTIALVSVAGGTIGLAASAQDPTPLGRALEFLFVVWVAAMFLFRNAYFLFFELGPRGATPGKRITGIRIAARDGGRLSAEMVIARNLLRDIELFLPLVFLMSASDGGDMGAAGLAATAWFLIFALFPLFNRDRLRAGDLIAGSWVVEAPRLRLPRIMASAGTKASTDSAGGSPAEPGLHGIAFSEAELSVYGEYELQTLERILRESQPDAQRKVHAAIAAKIGRVPAAGEERAFLEAYYAQLRARLEAGMRLGRRKADKFT
jgi:uncharacterized RDD family membrane protein YckC